jgi:hypothetical protein
MLEIVLQIHYGNLILSLKMNETEEKRMIWTIGHSALTLSEFINMLKLLQVSQILHPVQAIHPF